MEIDKNIIKILKRFVEDEVLDCEEGVRGYYKFLRANLSEDEIKEYAKKRYDIYDVDEWVMLRNIFGEMSYSTAMQISNLLWNEDFEIMEANVGDIECSISYELEDEADYVWENYFKDLVLT